MLCAPHHAKGPKTIFRVMSLHCCHCGCYRYSNCICTATDPVGGQKRTEMSDEPSPMDVLTLKGAAAQQTTHPGNLFYYKLCEERFAEYDALDPVNMSDRRREICKDIVFQVQQNGGIFRDLKGKPMKSTLTISKTQNRMRQIKRPKQVPPPKVGENDVVFKSGAANHLFPGNAKWRALVDNYHERYFPALVTSSSLSAATTTSSSLEGEGDSKLPLKKTNVTKRPVYQIEVAEELMKIIQDRGGKFRGGANLRELTEKEVIRKIHERFKDVKKAILKGKVIIRNETEYKLKRTGCTSAHSTVLYGKMPSKASGTKTKLSKKVHGTGRKLSNDDESDGEESFDSGILTDNEIEGDEESGNNEEMKIKQDQARAERTKRRATGILPQSSPSPKRKKRPKPKTAPTVSNVSSNEPTFESMSDYEKLRSDKMKRNQERLAQLGLLSNSIEEV